MYLVGNNEPQAEDVLFEISNKNLKEFTPKQAMSCLNPGFKEKLDEEKLLSLLDELVAEGVILKRAKKFLINDSEV